MPLLEPRRYEIDIHVFDKFIVVTFISSQIKRYNIIAKYVKSALCG